jgi:hypothetical protein
MVNSLKLDEFPDNIVDKFRKEVERREDDNINDNYNLPNINSLVNEQIAEYEKMAKEKQNQGLYKNKVS